MQGWSPPDARNDWYIPLDLVEWALVQQGAPTSTPAPDLPITPTQTPGVPQQPSPTPVITQLPSPTPVDSIDSTAPIAHRIVPLEVILDACEYLDQGDIPTDDFQPPADTIYVAVDGDDNNSGVIDAPFEHLDQAIGYANEHPDTPLTIYLREGIYYFKDPRNHPENPYLSIDRGNVYIAGYPNENVIIRPFYWPGNPTEEGDERVFTFQSAYSEFQGPPENFTFDNLQFEGWALIFYIRSPLDTPPVRNVTIKNITAGQFRTRGGNEEDLTQFLETGYLDDDVYGEGKVIFNDPETAHYQIENLILSNVTVHDADLPCQCRG